MKINRFFDKLREGPLLADGAMGTMLHARGIAFDRCFDELNLTHPALVADVHREYIDAGAQVIETNTFGANRYKLAGHGLEDSVAAINAAAVVLARRVVDASFKDVLIAGSVGPLGVRLAPFGRVKQAEAFEAFREQIAALVEAGVDLIVVETMADLNEAAEAVRAAKAVNPAVPVVASLTFTRDDRTLLGDEAAKAAAELSRAGADVIGVNCSSGPAQVLRLIQTMKAILSEVGDREQGDREQGDREQGDRKGRPYLSAMPNAGWPEQAGGRIMYPATPEYFAEYALAFVEAGAAIVGGCCGTTPRHIAAMRAALDQPERRPAFVSVSVAAEREERAVSLDKPTRLAEKLASGKFVVGVEMDPPRGFGAQKLIAGASLLAEAGADMINVADSPMARMRMSAWAACYLVQDRLGVEAVLHFPTRGRNLLRVQGDLLAAHALGVRNIFVVMGDPTSIGDYPEAMDNYDMTPSGLIKLVKSGFNEGVDQAGKPIGQPTSFFVGCALNLAAADPDREMKTLQKKIAAGADFALTQPVYEPGVAREFIERYRESFGDMGLPILVGVLPLYNARHANYLNNEVPGVTIPPVLLSRVERAGEGGAAEGVKMAQELLHELRESGVAQGAYLMPQFGRYDLAAEIIEAAKR